MVGPESGREEGPGASSRPHGPAPARVRPTLPRGRAPGYNAGVPETTPCEVRREGERLSLPGLATAHSHAFQRALRGLTQRKGRSGRDDFWSWRGLMYRVAARLTPEDVFALSRFAYAELALAGVTAVGEFHYLHHQPDGTPYADRLELADAAVRAAREVGLRIGLLRVLYARAGWKRPPEDAQRRFCDARLEDALDDVRNLERRYAEDPAVVVGVAPHSVRAVPREWLGEAARFASSRPLHAHVSEQPRELEECRAEHGLLPVELLAQEGALSERFVAVHATHLGDGEAALLGDAGASVCLCRTTERDLGDGLPNVSELLTAGARICLGVDSHAISCPFEEARAVELDERSRVKGRTVAAEAPALLKAASAEGYAALGMSDVWSEDRVVLDGRDPALVGARSPTLADSVIFGATPRAVREVSVGDRAVVREGVLVADYEGIRSDYEACLDRLLEG